MTDFKNKTFRVIDNGLYVSFARMLARQGVGRVEYYSPWQGAFPRSQQLLIGDGFDDIHRVTYPLEDADKVDLWCFLDVYHSDLQCYLESHGARVFGARHGDEMELHRWEFKDYLKKIGLPVQPCEHIIGFDELRKFLKTAKNKFVKTSFVRGDFETFAHESYSLSEPRLDELEHNLGPAKRNYEFIVEDEIPDAVEVGYDGFTVDGTFPSHAMMGYEVKDCGMLGVALPYEKLADPVKHVNKTLSSTLKGYNYRGFLSTEIRYTKKKEPFLIDPCCRLGTPSNELLQELFDGWPSVLWHGSEGVIKSPVPCAKFACFVVVHCEWAVHDWQCLHYPPSIDPFVKLRFHTKIDGKDYTSPQPIGLGEIGGVVGTGDTILEAIKCCKERADQIKGYQVRIDFESISKAIDVIKQGEKLGIKFADALPTPEEVQKAVA